MKRLFALYARTMDSVVCATSTCDSCYKTICFLTRDNGAGAVNSHLSITDRRKIERWRNQRVPSAKWHGFLSAVVRPCSEN